MKVEKLKILWLVGLLIVVSVGLVVAEQKADFNGDGQVNFTDFYLFCEQFGLAQGEPGFDARFDLDKSGEVDFSDFTALKRSFNTHVASAKVAMQVAAKVAMQAQAQTGVDATSTFTPASGQEFNTLAAAGNTTAAGIWSNGTTMWVADSGDDKIYAYNLATKQRDSAKDISTLSAAGNNNPTGIWSDGTTMWVADYDDTKLYAYALADGTRQDGTGGTTDKEITLHTTNGNPRGISSDGTTLWAVGFASTEAKIYAYNLSTKARDGTKDVTLDGNNLDPLGVWHDGATLWTVQTSQTGAGFLHTYNTATSQATRHRLPTPENSNSGYMWSNSSYIWVTDPNDDKLYAYNIVQTQTLVSNITETNSTQNVFERDYAQEFTTGVTGYTLTSVELDMGIGPLGQATFTMAVHASSGGQPGSRLATLTAPATFVTGANTFTHAGLDLAAVTSYFVVIDVTSGGVSTAANATASDNESSTAGWSISNVSHRRGLNSTGAYTTDHRSFKMRVNGLIKPNPKPPVPERWILAGNLDETTASTVALGTYDVAQQFTTGSNRDGYTVTSVELGLSFATASRASFRVAVHEDDNGQPGDRLGILGIQPQRFWADQYKWRHHGIALEPSTSYFLVLDSFSAGSGTIDTATAGNTEGEGRQTLANEYLRRARASTSDYSKIADSRLKIRINGDVNHGPEDLILTVSPTRIKEGDEPTTLTFTVTIGEARDKDFSFSVNHGKGYGEVYSCPGRRGNTNYRYYRSDCPPLAHGPNDWLHWTIPSQPLDYSIQGHAIGFKIPAGQTSVTDTYIITPYDDEKEEGEEYIFFIPAGGKYPAAQLILANREPAFAPTELTGLALAPVSGEPSKLAVSWNTVEDAATYDVRWKTVSGDYGDSVETTGNSYTITGLTADTNYTVNVAAVGEDDVVLAHATVTGPFWPVTVTAVEGSTDAVDVSWEAVKGAFHYFIRVNGGQRIEVRDGKTSRRITGLEADTEYTFALEAVSAMRDGFETLAEREVTGSTNALQPLEPGALEGLTVHPVSGETTKLAVAWHAVSDAERYVVKWKAGSDDYNSGEEATSTRHTISGLTAGTAYTVQVTAIDTDAEPDAELAVGEASGATLAAMGAVSVSAVEGSSDILEVSWPAVPGATGYVVAWKTGNEVYRAFASSETEATRGRITGLKPETAYTVRVTARHTIGGVAADGDSAEGSGTTNAPSANTPASGTPTISGTARVGETLTAATSGISDADGLTNASFGYQWSAGGSDISGATSNTYTLVDGDVGKAIKVTVSFTDDAGNAESLTSAATAAVVADEQQDSTPAVSFVIYHDPDAGTAAVNRYNQAVALLDDAGIAYSVVSGDVQADANRLAGVTNSVMPRFFLGDPTAEDWVSETKVNNGGLRWFKEKVAELSDD